MLARDVRRWGQGGLSAPIPIQGPGPLEKLGPGVAGWAVGDRVMSLVGGGGYAEYAVAHGDLLIPIPAGMSFESAAAVCESSITAFLNLYREAGLRDGETLLIHGGGGGVSTAAVQIVRALSPNVRIALTHAPEKRAGCSRLGVDCLVDYVNEDFFEAVRAFTGQKGVDVILDHLGAAYLDRNMRSLAIGGRLVVIGVTGGIKAELNLGLMMVRRQRVIGSVLRSRPLEEKAAITADFRARVLPRLSDGSIAPIIDRVFPLEEVRDAHGTMEADLHFGKIILTMS